VARKTISIPDEVYERLRAERREEESFGETIDRLLGDRGLSEFWDDWSDETAVEARDAMAEGGDRAPRRNAGDR
jgi:predicted CopG family antitoxin